MQKFIAILASYGVTGTARVRRGYERFFFFKASLVIAILRVVDFACIL